jgi:uncharacterized membrane protein YfcA
MMVSAALFAALAAASVVTSFVSGILGMAGGMILLGILLAALPLPAAMALHGMTQLASNGWRAAMLRREVDWRVIRGYTMGALLALGVFALARVVLNKPGALIAMGLTPFVGLALPERLHLNVERRGHSLACGFLCVCLALTAGIAGPILDLFFVRSRMGRHSIVATKALTQTLSHLLKIVYFGRLVGGAEGHVDPWLAGTMVVLAFAGTTLSAAVLERMSDASFRRWTRLTIVTLGVVYLASGVSALVG